MEPCRLRQLKHFCPAAFLPTSVESKPKLPVREKAGKSWALETPIWAHWAAALYSAARISGRRRSRSTGMPTATWAGGAGIAALVPAIARPVGSGGSPSRTLRAFLAWRSWVSRTGMVAWVPARTVLACSTSRWEVVPPSKPGLGDLQALPLGLDVLPGDVEPLFQGADGDVEIRHVAGEAHQGAVIIGDAGQQAGVGGLDGPAELAPKIDLPAGRQADLGFPVAEAAESRGRSPGTR